MKLAVSMVVSGCMKAIFSNEFEWPWKFAVLALLVIGAYTVKELSSIDADLNDREVALLEQDAAMMVSRNSPMPVDAASEAHGRQGVAMDNDRLFREVDCEDAVDLRRIGEFNTVSGNDGSKYFCDKGEFLIHVYPGTESQVFRYHFANGAWHRAWPRSRSARQRSSLARALKLSSPLKPPH